MDLVLPLMVNLPDDIMLDICVRLPVKSIGKFRCANKNWYKLLNDHEFVQKHLCHSTEINRLSLILHSRRNYQDHIYTIDYDPSASTCSGFVNTILPFVANKVTYYQFLGYCNGLVCISKNVGVHCLWNPSTNEYKQLPVTPVDTTPDFYAGYYIEGIQGGFGRDYKIGEFKVVCLTQYGHYPDCVVQGSIVHLYILRSQTWKTLDSIPYIVYGQPDIAQVPVNGIIHWDAYREYDEAYRRVILSFDFEKEIFQEMPWPNLSSEEFTTSLCVLGGSLCICGFDPDIGVEVWELKECEVRKSWNKLFTIDVILFFGPVKDFVPLQLLKNGEFLFGFDTDVGFQVHQYDPKHETTRLLFLYADSGEYSSSVATYVESLVSLNSG